MRQGFVQEIASMELIEFSSVADKPPTYAERCVSRSQGYVQFCGPAVDRPGSVN